MIVENLGKVSEDDIVKLEEKIQTPIPVEYRTFLKDTNGVISKDNTTIYISELGAEVEIDSLFGIHNDKKWLDINYNTSLFYDDLPPNAIVIGRDLLGGFFVMICNEDDSRLYYWDDKYNFEKSNDDSNAYYIADGFNDFVDLLNGFIAHEDL